MSELTSSRYVIVDMDGTIADCSDRLHLLQSGFYDWAAFEAACIDDEPRRPIINLVRLFHNSGFKILIVTARTAGLGLKQTMEWLEQYRVPCYGLFMREDGDSRPDFEVKQDILNNKLPTKDQIAYVLEDRKSVTDMYRKNGLTCLQVAEGNY